jgi:hypothetical protein
VRSPFGARGYDPQFAQWADPALWWASFKGLGLQAGPMLLPAAIGTALLVGRGRDARWLLPGAVGLGVELFLLADRHVETIGTPRFQLLLLPPILVLGWRALAAANRRPALGIALSLGVVVGNIALRPVDLQGRRAYWSGIEERRYPYRECFEEIRRADPNARVLLVNMELPYGAAIVASQMRWEATIHQDVNPDLERALRQAAEKEYGWVVWRAPPRGTLGLPAAQDHFVRSREFDGLLVYRRR